MAKMVRICINNGKGGVSKTITTCSVAGILANEYDKKVLIIDTDTQGNASTVFGCNTSDDLAQAMEKTVYLEDIIQKTKYPNIDIIPASKRLTAIGADLKGSKEEITRLRSIMRGLNDHDYCLIDTAPSLDIIPQNVMAASDFMLIPLEPSEFAVNGLIDTKEAVDSIKEEANPGLKILGMFLSRIDSRTNFARDMVSLLERHWGDLVMKSAIRNNIALTESITAKKIITDYDSNSNGAQDYRALTEEMIIRLRRYNHE